MSQIYKDVDKFLYEIKKSMLCPTSQKDKIIGGLKDSILDYVEENNITDITKVYEHFGEPQNIANQMISYTEPRKIINAMSVKKILLTGIIIALLIFSIVIIGAAIDGHRDVGGYYIESVAFISNSFILNGR